MYGRVGRHWALSEVYLFANLFEIPVHNAVRHFSCFCSGLLYIIMYEQVLRRQEKYICIANIRHKKIQGPVVQSVVSLTSSLRVISLTILADSIYNFLKFFAEKNVSSFCTAKATHIFSAKNFRIFVYHSM